MKNLIKLRINSKKNGIVNFSICEQFLTFVPKNGLIWNSSNGIELRSEAMPEWDKELDIFYLRGYDKTEASENCEMLCTEEDFEAINFAINEFMHQKNSKDEDVPKSPKN